jgi:hypothetical protein
MIWARRKHKTTPPKQWKSGKTLLENGRPWHFSEVKFHFRMCYPDTIFGICSLSLSHTYMPIYGTIEKNQWFFWGENIHEDKKDPDLPDFEKKKLNPNRQIFIIISSR